MKLTKASRHKLFTALLILASALFTGIPAAKAQNQTESQKQLKKKKKQQEKDKKWGEKMGKKQHESIQTKKTRQRMKKHFRDVKRKSQNTR